MGTRVIFMGTPAFAVPSLQCLIDNSYEVVGVYTQPDKPSGRSRHLASPPVKQLAVEKQIPVKQPDTLKSVEAVEELASFEPDLIVVAAFGRILPRELLSLPRFGCLNVHPSLLPRHRGPSPMANAILCGDQFTGVTIMLVEQVLDSGPILSRRELIISPEDTTGSLSSRLAQMGAQLLMETLPGWIRGEIEPKAQEEALVTHSRKITSEEGRIDWQLSAEEIWRQIRAYNPWPGSYAYWQGKRLKVHQATPLAEAAQGELGKVVTLPGSAPVELGVVTGRGVLGLYQVQLEGKRQMPLTDFVRGHRDFIGSILV